MTVDGTPASDEFALGGLPVDAMSAELMRQRLRARMFGEPESLPQIARFRVIESIASGGMGAVYLAWDEGLARSVALKFLHQSNERGELLAEAQALARLAHPNVVAVFDVGVHEGRVWLAMEYVPGRTLRAWAREQPASADRLTHWIAAGRGLAAVHAAGLIHRDVKPDNVLLGADGRVRIVDFGLVLASQTASTETSSISQSSSSSTLRLGFAGTRGYAPPEQQAGSAIDERADQYAYCVSVWEALAGERPDRDEAGALLAPDISGVPRRVLAALRRGLAVNAHDRWPSMIVLLAALEPRRRRIDLVIAIAIATSLGLGIGLAGREEAVAGLDPCALAGSDLDASAAGPLAEGPLRVATEAWIGEWQRSSVRACTNELSEAVHVQRRACLEVRRLELVGLIDHLVGVQAGVHPLDTGRLELGDPEGCLLGADEALALPHEQAAAIAELRRQLVDLDRRKDASALERLVEAEQLLVQARAIAWPPLIGEAALALARIHLSANDSEPARALVGEVLDLAQQHNQSELAARAWATIVALGTQIDLDPDAADWAWQRERAVFARLGATALDRGRLARDRASIAVIRGDPGSAEVALREAVDEFQRAGLAGRLQLLTTLDRLAFVVGVGGREPEMRVLHARARTLEHELAASRDRPSGGDLQADRHFDASQLALASGDTKRAKYELERALVAHARASGPESQQVAKTHVALAQVLDAEGSFDEAELHARRADEICLSRLAATHPLRAATLSALGTIALRRGDHEASLRSFRLALQIEETRPGGGAVDRGLARSNLAEALLAAGKWSAAGEQAELALTELETRLPADHPDLAYPHKALGWALLEIEEFDRAGLHLARALELTTGSVAEANEIRKLLARMD